MKNFEPRWEKNVGILLGNVLFGCVAGILAHTKARNALGWFIAGCLIGPFSIVVALLPTALKEGVTKRCPYCAEPVLANASICRHCRSELGRYVAE
jgi:hypothetical protein